MLAENNQLGIDEESDLNGADYEEVLSEEACGAMLAIEAQLHRQHNLERVSAILTVIDRRPQERQQTPPFENRLTHGCSSASR